MSVIQQPRTTESPGGYAPVRTTRLTEALRRNLNTLDFGRPSNAPRRPDAEDVDDALEVQVLSEKHDHGHGQVGVGFEEVFVTNMKKQSRKEINPKTLSPEKLKELDLAKAKEWSKMMNSGAIKLHVGKAAKELVEEVGIERVLGTRYVYTTDDGTLEGTLKARWCVQGYMDPDVLDLNTASPTLSMEGFAVTAQLITSMNWKMKIADVEAAFLRGEAMSRAQGKVLVRVPKDGIPGVESDAIIELVKPVYGLVDAPKRWWNTLSRTLVSLGMSQSKLDSCVFVSRHPDTKELCGGISVHVDDMLIGGNMWFYENIFHELSKIFPFKHVKEGKGEFLGKFLEQKDDGTLVVHQKEYAEAVKSIALSKERRRERESKVTERERSQMRAVLGEVNWLVTGSRPDLAGMCSLLQQKVANATVEDIIAVNKAVAHVHDFAGMEIRFKPIEIKDVEIAVWSDASFANTIDRKSQGGYLIAAVDRNLRSNKWSVVSPWRWRSFQQERQVSSTLGAELLTMSRAIAEAKWMRSMWTEITCQNYTLESDGLRSLRTPITLMIDSKPAYDHLHGQAMSIKDKRLAIEMLLVKQDVEKENIEARWIPTDQMLVDSLTKVGAPMCLLRRVLKEGRFVLVQNEEMQRWAGKIARKSQHG